MAVDISKKNRDLTPILFDALLNTNYLNKMFIVQLLHKSVLIYF